MYPYLVGGKCSSRQTNNNETCILPRACFSWPAIVKVASTEMVSLPSSGSWLAVSQYLTYLFERNPLRIRLSPNEKGEVDL